MSTHTHGPNVARVSHRDEVTGRLWLECLTGDGDVVVPRKGDEFVTFMTAIALEDVAP